MKEPGDLILRVKKIYFDQIKSGEKPFEYRLRTPYWQKRIAGRVYKRVIITHGYPPKGDSDRTIAFPWSGYIEQDLTHEHFGNASAEVYAIKLMKEEASHA